MDKQAWEVSLDEWIEQGITGSRYADHYKDNERARKALTQNLEDKWYEELLERALVGRIATPALDDYVARHGIHRMLHIFRAPFEAGVTGYSNPEDRLWDKTYKQVLEIFRREDGRLPGLPENMTYKGLHCNDILDALEQGEDVPESVLREYPDLVTDDSVAKEEDDMMFEDDDEDKDVCPCSERS